MKPDTKCGWDPVTRHLYMKDLHEGGLTVFPTVDDAVDLRDKLTAAIASVPVVVEPPHTGGVTATLAAVLPAPETYSGLFRTGYSDSIAVTAHELVRRENYGYSTWSLGAAPTLQRAISFQDRPGYQKVGDGYQTVANVAASADGSRVVAGWKQDTHGTLLLDAAGRNSGEWDPPRCFAGVAVGQVGAKVLGYSLSPTSLSVADITVLVTGPNATKRGSIQRASLAVMDQPVERTLVATGRFAAYVGVRGFLTVVTDGVSMSASMVGAASVGLEGKTVLAGVFNGTQRMDAETCVLSPITPLPGTPSVVALLNAVAFAWVGSSLYAEGVKVLDVDPGLGPIAVMRGLGSFLYCGTANAVFVVRIS